MSVAPEAPDVGYQSWSDIARGARHLADTLRVIGRAIPASQSERATPRDRADALHVLALHVPALYRESTRLARAAERMAIAGQE